MADSVSGKRADRRSKRWQRSRRHNPDGSMSLIEHVYEFRRRLGFGMLFVVLGGICGFLWFMYSIGPIPSLSDLLKGPYCDLSTEVRANFGAGKGCQLLQTQPFEILMLGLKVGIAAGMVLFAPAWLYQIWAFVAPGLRSKERKYTIIFLACASVLFAAGAVLAYVMVPHALDLLTGFGGDFAATGLTADKYVSFILTLLLIFGVSFELPLLVVMLNQVGVLRYNMLKKWRRGIIMGLFVFAAFATPGNDPFSMLALALALTLLCELAIQVARIHDRKKDRIREDEGWDQLDDDEAAPFEYTPTAAEEPSGSRTDDVT